MYSSSLKPQEFSSFSLIRTHSIRCTSDCTMEQIISCWRPSWSYYQAPSTRIHFLLKMRFFFAVFKIDPFTRSVFESFSSVQKCPFSFENANVFSVFDNLSVLSYRFWYCDIVFKKFRFEESTRKQKNSAFNVKSSHAKSSWFLYSTQAGGGGREETRSGTEKRCSHYLQSGHPAWWSADNCSIFLTVNFQTF